MKSYSTAAAAESAFYEAFEKADIDSMMSVWANDENVVCIHPGAPRVEGLASVRESWVELFRDPPILRFSLLDVRITKSDTLAIHQVREEIEIDGQYISQMISTNIYERDNDANWHMTSRHSSPEPDDYEIDELFSAEDEIEADNSAGSRYLLH